MGNNEEQVMLRFEESFVLADLEAADSDQVINELAERLHQAGMVNERYADATIEREIHHPTGLPTRPFPIAFPHADADGVLESALAVACLKYPVTFKNMADPDEDLAVEIVIMLANKSPEEQIQTLRSLAELFGEVEKLSELRNISEPISIMKWLKKELFLEE
jgi:PTS system galactitol-specific IIA component